MIRKAHTVLLLRPFFHLFQFPVPFENDVVNRALRIIRIIAMIVVEGNADSFRRIHKTGSFPQRFHLFAVRLGIEVAAKNHRHIGKCFLCSQMCENLLQAKLSRPGALVIQMGVDDAEHFSGLHILKYHIRRSTRHILCTG